MKKFTTKDLIFMAMYAALFVLFDRLTDLVPLFSMPSGGKLNFATVVLLLASYHLGWQKGLLTGVVVCILMFITGSISYYGIVSLLFDYLLAYIGYGLACIFPNYGLFFSGVLITNLFRLACSTFAGIVVWETPFWGSLSYNATYMLPTIILDLIMVPLIYKAMKPIIKD